eukprot:GFKZ01008446.1.p1 GENE.GFKZ01008446.1~~GFKZ01008446.1.p1  ORF type:complete len:1673 (-),score=232.88 GFKZ01008446.1:2229-7247(-)
MEVELHPSDELSSDPPLGIASPPPSDGMLPTPARSHLRPSPHNQVTTNANPVSVDTPTETPHDLFCLAKEYERRGRIADAANLYLKASMNGHLSAMVSYASHLVPSDERAAFVWFRAAAERGDPRAWAELGQLLARGRYFEVNAIDAARCWKRAAQMGDNTGKSALGLCYIRGFGVKQDPEKGIEIVRQVADVHNDVTAMKNLAWIYRHGKGVPKNREEAEYWDKRAKKQEDIMNHVTSREQVLFGRGRVAKHARQKVRDTKPPAVDTTLEQGRSNRSRQSVNKPEPLVEEDIQKRLQSVSDDPARNAFDEARGQSPSEAGHTARSDRQAVEERDITTQKPEHKSQGEPGVDETAVAPSFAETIRQLEERAIRELEENNRKPKSELGAAVQTLGFTPNTQSDTTTVTEVGRFDLPTQGGKAVQAPVATRLSEDTPRSLTQNQDEIQEPAVSVTVLEAAADKSELVDENSEEQFITPEQSLENEATEPTSAFPKQVTAGVGGIATAAVVALSQEEDSAALPQRDDEGRSTTTPTGAGLSSFGLSSETAEKEFSPSDMQPGRVPFESSRLMADSGMGSEISSSMRKGNSYALNVDSVITGAGPGNELDEFEEADMQRMAGEAPSAQHAYGSESPVSRSSRAMAFSRVQVGQEAVTSAAGTADSVGSPSRSTFGGTVGQTSVGGTSEPPTHIVIKDLLALYPKNPLRSDSQVPLFKLIDGVQQLPISDTQAFRILEEGNGFSKIVVAMLSQYEDPHLQEQGMHSLIRIFRTTSPNQREALALSPYADCYRNTQGDDDAVIPKGSLGIDERSSGAIQAVIHGMRRHPTVRRVQLAGCAALSEIAALSSSCRSVAYDHGAVNLVITSLRHRSSHAAASIHDVGCRAVTSFCSGKENLAFKEAFTSAGVITELLNVLQLWGHIEKASLELPVTATKSCCAALRSVTDGYPVASGQCVQSFAYHHLVRAMSVRREDVSAVTAVVSAMTSITRNAGLIAEKGLLDAKPLPEVLVTMQTHADELVFIRKALEFMESLGSFSSMREEIVQAGGIPFAADIIQQGGTDALLLERACGVIEKLCRSHPKHQELFTAHDGVLSLTKLLRTHQGLPGVVERALFALTSACSGNSRAQKEAVKAGTPEQVVRSIGGYSSKNAKVAAAGSSSIAALVVPRNAAMAQGFSKLKAPELIIRTMKKHPDSVVVQENGSAAISSICEADPRIVSTLLKSGISSVLVVGLQRFLHKQTAVVQIVRAMRALSNEASDDSYRFKSKLLTDRSNESSLSEIFHTALSYHKKGLPDSANVIISICATINRLCMKSVAFKNEIGKDGIVEELKRLVERTAEFKDLGALQPVLATICTLVLDSEDNKNRFHAVGGVEAILDVMQKWKSDTYVLEHCCAALRYSCNEHFGNCDEVKNHNGVRSILGIMELHPENVNVTLWCCLTLADLCKGDEELQSSPNVVQGIRKVVSAMSMFSSNSRFLASACEFLRAASVDNPDNQERIVRLGGRTAIVKALETHPGDNSLTEAGAYALLQIQDIKDTRGSVDNNSQMGLVKRISRELRRSGSSSAKSNRGAGKISLLGRKSRSFNTRKKQPEEDIDEDLDAQDDEEEVLPRRNLQSRASLMSFSRGSRFRGKKSKTANIPPVEELEDLKDDVMGEDDDYDEFVPAPADGFDPQID